jgi:hypothetical protein
VSAENQERLRAYTACIREHGMPDWPDADPTGRYLLPASYPEGLGKGDRAIDRTFQAALAACERLAVEGTQIG